MAQPPQKTRRLDLRPDQVDALRRLLDVVLKESHPAVPSADWRCLHSVRFALNTPEERKQIEEVA